MGSGHPPSLSPERADFGLRENESNMAGRTGKAQNEAGAKVKSEYSSQSVGKASNASTPSASMSPQAGRSHKGPTDANNGEGGRKISCTDIQLVQNLIERCLQLYMSQREVVSTLQSQAKIEPGFTSLVWLKLEEQNPEFFRAYYTRLKLKDQIVVFNHLLEQHVHMMNKLRNPGGWGRHGQQGQGMNGGGSMGNGQMQGGNGMWGHSGQSSGIGMDSTPGSYPGDMPGWGSGGQQGGGQGGASGSGGFPGAGGGAPLPTGGHLSPNLSPSLSPAMPPPFGEGGAAGAGDARGGVNLGPLPRNFSLSDLSLDLEPPPMAEEGENTPLGMLGSLGMDNSTPGDFKLPRNFSLSDMAPLEMED